MRKWINDDRMMIACCNDGTRQVIFKIERIDIPENDEEREWLSKLMFYDEIDCRDLFHGKDERERVVVFKIDAHVGGISCT